MPESSPTIELSPLDQIRLVEAEITRKIVAAREASERAIAEARLQAALTKKQARETGEHGGQIRYKGIVSDAEEEAKATIAHTQHQVADLRTRGQEQMDAAVQEAAGIVLGLKGGGASNES